MENANYVEAAKAAAKELAKRIEQEAKTVSAMGERSILAETVSALAQLLTAITRF